MTNYEILTQLDWEGNEYEIVRIDRGNNEFTMMPKALWDELEAAKQTGTIS